MQGDPEIKRVTIRQREVKKPEDRALWLDVESSNFLRVLGTRGVDFTGTKSNNIYETWKTLGTLTIAIPTMHISPTCFKYQRIPLNFNIRSGKFIRVYVRVYYIYMSIIPVLAKYNLKFTLQNIGNYLTAVFV